MRERMEKWLQKFQITFLGLCYQLEKGDINEADFTGGLCVLTGKKPEEVAEVLRNIKGQQETFDDFVTSTLSRLSTKYNLPPPKWQVIRSEKAYYDWDKKLLEIPQFLKDAWPEAKGPLVSHIRHEFCHYRQDMEGRGNLPEHELEAECFKFEAGKEGVLKGMKAKAVPELARNPQFTKTPTGWYISYEGTIPDLPRRTIADKGEAQAYYREIVDYIEKAQEAIKPKP